MLTEAGKNNLRSFIFSVFSVHAPSRSFDYAAIRVQSSAPVSAPMPVTMSQLENRSYVAAIRQLSTPAAAWVRWAYASRHPDAANHDMEIVARNLWDDYSSTLHSTTEEQRERIMRLVQPAMEQVAVVQRLGKKRYSRADLYDLTGCPESSWQRDMQPHWKALQDNLKNQDNAALRRLSLIFDIVDQRKALGSAYEIAANAQMSIAV